MKIVDSHCHLNDEQLINETSDIIQRANELGVYRILVPGWDIDSSIKSISIANSYENIYSAVGIHPENLDGLTTCDVSKIEDLAKEKKVIAIGEIGLDLHYRTDNLNDQLLFLEKQIDLSIKLDLPFIIHMRDATGQFMDFIRAYKKKNGIAKFKGIMHSYSGSTETMNDLIDMGFLISFSGPVTFKNARIQKECASACPLDKMLVETDSPYMSPVPFRGTRNEPKNTFYTLQYISNLKGISEEQLANITTNNFNRLFNLED